MINKFISFFVLVLFFNISIAQITGEVIYKKRQTKAISELPENKSLAKENPKRFRILQLLDNNVKLILENLNFNLSFNKKESVFQAEDFLEQEKNPYLEPALSLGLGVGTFYNNIPENKTINKMDIIGETFLVHQPEVKWTLTNIEQKIGGYNCYKAKTEKVIKKHNGDIHKIEIVAWYTPQIPVPFGPVGYGRLPGLIILLQYGDYIEFVAKKVDLKAKADKKLDIPSKGKEITEAELNEKLNKAMQNFN